MATTSDVDKRKRHEYGLRLIRGFLHFIIDLAEQDITINRFYAISSTLEGNAILQRAKFEERGHTGKRVAFDLNPFTSQARLAKAYSVALRRHHALYWHNLNAHKRYEEYL
jgi:hypothetical protein